MNRRAHEKLFDAPKRLSAQAIQFWPMMLVGTIIGQWGTLAIVACFLLIFASVSLPAIWSSRSFRRKAALDVLRLLLQETK